MGEKKKKELSYTEYLKVVPVDLKDRILRKAGNLWCLGLQLTLSELLNEQLPLESENTILSVPHMNFLSGISSSMSENPSPMEIAGKKVFFGIGMSYLKEHVKAHPENAGFLESCHFASEVGHGQPCLRELADACFLLADAFFEAIDWKPENMTERLMELFIIHADILTCFSCEALGAYRIVVSKKRKYKRIQGANSKEVGDLSKNEAKKILEKYGGIQGYGSLGYGQKKPVKDEIQSKLKFKDDRQVFNILKELKDEIQNN